MKNRGFTLIELLAVLIIISLLSILIFRSINEKTNEYRNISSSEFEKLIESSAHSYIISSNTLTNSVKSGNIEEVSIQMLVEKDYLSNKLIQNPNTNKEIDIENSFVKVGFQNNKYTYEIIIVDKSVK